MQHTTKTLASMTVREAGDMAAQLGMPLSELFQLLGQIPMPPAGYTLDPKSTDRWIGPETVHRGWILTQTWYASSNTHYVEVWLAEHTPPNYSPLTSAEALELAAELTAASQATTA